MTEECIVLSLYDNKLEDEEKRQIADGILASQRHASYTPGNREFNTNTLLEPDVTLAFSVSTRSWVVFDIIESTGEWMSLPVDRWEKSDEYINMASVVTELSVVNDTAERGVMDVKMLRKTHKQGAIILMANSHRVKMPDF